METKKVLILVCIAFILGIAFSGTSYLVIKKTKPVIKKVIHKLKERKIANIPKAKKRLSICSFESKGDLEKWIVANAKMELSKEYATSGKYSAKIYFQPSSAASLVKIEDYFEKNRYIRDWTRYETLSFDIFNPNSKTERIILQIKDLQGHRIKKNLYLRPNVSNVIDIDIRGLWDEIRPNEIGQFNLFLWNNSSKKVFYLDSIRLLPAAALEKRGKSILKSEFLPKQGESIYRTGDYFAFDYLKWQREDVAKNTSFIQVPLIINNYLPSNLAEHCFVGGIPFAKGQLQSLEKIELVDVNGDSVPFQAKILSQWSDGSIKWALFDAKTGISGGEKKQIFLRYGKQIKKTIYKSKLAVKEYPNEIIVNTGNLQFSLDKKKFYLFDKVWLDKNNDKKFDNSEIISARGDLVLVHKGKEYYSSLDKNYEFTIEEQSPLKVCLKAKGWFTSKHGEKFCQFIVRIYAIEGLDYLKIQHTFVYTGYPENKFHYLYEGKRLPHNETIEAIYVKIPLGIGKDSKFTFAADNKIMQAELTETIEFRQGKFNDYSITGENKVINLGSKLSGWVDVSTEEEGVSLGIKNFWQQFPKGFRLDKKNQCITTYLWPKEAGELDLKTTASAYGPDAVARGSAFGLAKTHELFFYFHRGDFNESYVGDIMTTLGSDVTMIAHPEWVADTKVLGNIRAYDKRLKPAELFLSRLFDWGARQIERFHWYGMIDFGDTLTWYRKDAYDKSYDDWGWHPEGRWGWFSCEVVGIHSGALIQFLRTGDYKYFIFGANLARHIMDIDTCHYNTVDNDKRLKRRISDDYSQVGSMHRHNGNHWGGRNEEASHTNVYGLLLYYYITGDSRARDVIDEVGQFFLSEPITYFRHPDIAPQRTIANILWGDVFLYELTGDERYKHGADKWAQLLYEGQKHDGSWPENYNPVKRKWEGKLHMGFIRAYTLPALISYHRLTGNKAIAECIIKATDFVINNEKYGAYFNTSAYCYWLTEDSKYLDNIKERLDFTVRHQRTRDDLIWDGMVYQKATYARVMEYLYNMPFAFEVIASGRKKKND